MIKNRDKWWLLLLIINFTVAMESDPHEDADSSFSSPKKTSLLSTPPSVKKARSAYAKESPDRFATLADSSPYSQIDLLARRFKGDRRRKVNINRLAAHSLSRLSKKDSRHYDAGETVISMGLELVSPKAAESPVGSYDALEGIAAVPPKDPQLKRVKALARELPSVPSSRKLDFTVDLNHLSKKTRGKGGHLSSIGDTEFNALISESVSARTIPVENVDSGILYMGEKSLFPRYGFKFEKLIEKLALAHRENRGLAKTNVFDARGGVIGKRVLYDLGYSFFIETFETDDPEYGVRVSTAYPIFAYADWYEDADISLGRIKSMTDETAPILDLRLSADKIITLVKEAQNDFEHNILPDPTEYSLEDSYIVDLAPILKKKFEDGTSDFWGRCPHSIISKGIYIRIPKHQIDS